MAEHLAGKLKMEKRVVAYRDRNKAESALEIGETEDALLVVGDTPAKSVFIVSLV